MKNILTTLIYLLSFITNAQTQEATLHFNDGTSIEGYGLIFQEHKIKFKASKNDEPSVWTGVIVSGITFHGFEYDLKFEYVYTKKSKRYPLLLEVLTGEGEVTLYTNITSDYSFGKESKPLSILRVEYFTKRQNEEIATKLKGNFRKNIIKYFGECSGIIKRIDNHEFRWETLIELVNYYNDFCAEE